MVRQARARTRRWRRPLTWIVIALVAGCTGVTGHSRLHINFPDPEARALTHNIELWIMPQGAADCAALIQGTASPGDPDLPVLAHCTCADATKPRSPERVTSTWRST